MEFHWISFGAGMLAGGAALYGAAWVESKLSPSFASAVEAAEAAAKLTVTNVIAKAKLDVASLEARLVAIEAKVFGKAGTPAAK